MHTFQTYLSRIQSQIMTILGISSLPHCEDLQALLFLLFIVSSTSVQQISFQTYATETTENSSILLYSEFKDLYVLVKIILCVHTNEK